MKKMAYFGIIVLLLSNCKTTPISKIELPVEGGNPPNIVFSRTVSSNGNKSANYDSVMKTFMGKYPESKIAKDDKSNYYFLIKSDFLCKYKGTDKKLSYSLIFQAEDKECTISITRIYIGYTARLEKLYFTDSRKTIKKLNPCYEDLKGKINGILDLLEKQIK